MVCCPHSNYYLAALANVINGTFRDNQGYLNTCFPPPGSTLKLFISWKKRAWCQFDLFLWSSCVTRMRAWAAGDDSQVTLCFTCPPINFSKGGDKRKLAQHLTEPWNDSLSSLSTPTLLRCLSRGGAATLLTCITVPSAPHCIADWLTDWLTHCCSCGLLLCFLPPHSHLYHAWCYKSTLLTSKP